MRRRLEERFETEALPLLREKLTEQFQSQRRQDHQAEEKRRNFIFVMLINLKNRIQNCVAFLFTMAFLIPLWIFKTILKCFDLVERCLRFVLWLHVKGIVLVINFVYKVLQYLGITTAVNFFKRTVNKYLGNYSMDQTEVVSGTEVIMSNEQHNLIDVKKVQKRIKTPNIFLSHQESNKHILVEDGKEDYVERINRDLVPERTVHQNIVETPHRLKSPQLLALSESHFRLKRNSTEPNLLASERLENQISLNREQTSSFKRMEPDRDISPQRYNKTSLLSFKKKQTPEKQILMLHHHKLIHGTKTEKEILEQQLLTLRTKMEDLINQNNKQIHQLQNWIQEKSQTITMARKENLQLLNKIQQLQKESIKKNQKFTELQIKIRQMEQTLEKQKSLRTGLNSQVEKLEEEIKTKIIEIMSLKDKIKKNFMHLKQMETIFGSENLVIQNSPEQQILTFGQIEDSPIDLGQSLHSLKKEFNEMGVYDISNRYLPTVKKVEEISEMKEVDEIPNPKEIEDVQKSHETESEIQQSEKMILEQEIQKATVKTSPQKISLQKSTYTPEYQQTSITNFIPLLRLDKQTSINIVTEVEDFLIKQQQLMTGMKEQQSVAPIKKSISNPISTQNPLEQIKPHKQQKTKRQIENLLDQEKQINKSFQKQDPKVQPLKGEETIEQSKKRKKKKKNC